MLFLLHVCYAFVRVCLLINIVALWSPAGKGLTSWLLFVMSYCEFVTFPLISWVRRGTLLYRFLIFALFHTIIKSLSQQNRNKLATRGAHLVPIGISTICLYVKSNKNVVQQKGHRITYILTRPCMIFLRYFRSKKMCFFFLHAR